MEPRSIATASDTRTNVKALGADGLEAFVQSLGQPAYRGRQLFKWLYEKDARTFEEMTVLPKSFREELRSKARIERIEPERIDTASDQTVKALFPLSSGRRIETVLIPDIDPRGEARRLTVCVSSQVGCAMGCGFCATGLMGFQQNLTPGEITDQVREMNTLALERFGLPVSNIVYMGMGEPLLNFDHVMTSIDILTHESGFGLSPRRITLSTVGLARRIKKVADTQPRINLAVSLHAPTDAQRSEIMPVNQSTSTNLTALREAITYYTEVTGRGVTYEYCLFDGVNDRVEDAHNLADVVAWAPSKVNIIMYNPVQGLDFARTPDDRLHRFIEALVGRGVTVTVRQSRGDDIDAACGQLAVQEA